MFSGTSKLASWLIINGQYDSVSVNPPDGDPGGFSRTHWDDLLRTMARYGALVVETMADAESSLYEAKEVVVIGGHSELLDGAKAVCLHRRDRKRIHPAAFPNLDGCRLLWLSTCFGETWLDHGLWEMLPQDAVVVASSSASPGVHGTGDSALRDLTYLWMDSFSSQWSGTELRDKVMDCLAGISQHEPQNLRLLLKSAPHQKLADAWAASPKG